MNRENTLQVIAFGLGLLLLLLPAAELITTYGGKVGQYFVFILQAVAGLVGCILVIGSLGLLK